MDSSSAQEGLRKRPKSSDSDSQDQLTLDTRVVNKIGERNVRIYNLPQRSIRFVKDLVTTLHAIETKVTAVLLASRRTAEGEEIEKNESYLKLENDGRLVLLWPVTACHVIDRDSPLYDVSAADLLERKLEIVITITGGTMTTGQINQARTSYVPSEICWGHRFRDIVEYDARKQSYVAVNERMHEIEQVDTPLCSARQLDMLKKRLQRDVKQDRPASARQESSIIFKDNANSDSEAKTADSNV
uniref:Inward rectifier potassium channel C-terminal domain-containing protein n=1 Tax=Anopheles coluzzii TaxID=1518534 RepID=A0A8W7PFE7_ANOCL